MESKKPGKQGTKGAKQIVEENKATLKFYLYMISGSAVAYFLLQLIFGSLSSWGTITLTVISLLAQIASYKFMEMMSRPNITETGQVLDAGTDLNMEGGIAEHVKDVIILTSGTMLLSIFSHYFWWALLFAPLRALYMLWGSVIQPWLQQKDEKPEQVDDKKQKKLERRMKRTNVR
ncbi:transmembrane protein 208 [Culicoides brevitarsis]|uniref:transmembrane protein 208 n=1 Tax=Culicoides brevitarsis TaxID=469753 RepID=UPI00307C9B3C